MISLEKVRLVQFYLFEQEEVELKEITGIFGPNGSGKSTLLDAVQIAMFGANENLTALNAQADENKNERSARSYCLGKYGDTSDQRARDNATTYITLIWRNDQTGEPLSMGVCIYASSDREGSEVMGRYILPGIELSLGDHLEVVNGDSRPRAWPTFRHQLIDRSKVSGEDPLYPDSGRYIRAALQALRGSGSAPVSDAFTRAFRFALRMRFDKNVDHIVRKEVLENKPTNIKKFKEVTESFRQLKDMVEKVQAKITDGEKVCTEFDKALEEAKRLATWTALSKTGQFHIKEEKLDQVQVATSKAEDALVVCEQKMTQFTEELQRAKREAQSARYNRESHSAHKDYGSLQSAIQSATGRIQTQKGEISNSIRLVKNMLVEAAKVDFLEKFKVQILENIATLIELGQMVTADAASLEYTTNKITPCLKSAATLFGDLMEQGIELNRSLTAAKQQESQAKSNLERVSTGRAPLSSQTQLLMSILNDRGIQSTPVCDLVKITDSAWQPVIESFLGRRSEALLVPRHHEKEAFNIYRGIKGQDIYGAKLAMESRQPANLHPGKATVAALIEGKDPAAVAYLRRQFGELECAATDEEALAGNRTMTQDGMLVSGGDVERLRLAPAGQFRIGAGSADHRLAIQRDLDRCRGEIRRLEELIGQVSRLRDGLRPVSHEESILKHIRSAWQIINESQQEITTKTVQLQGAADEEYIRLGQEETKWSAMATELEGSLRDIAQDIGSAKSERNNCREKEKLAKEEYDIANKEASEARNHQDVDKDLENRQWDQLIERFNCDYPNMVAHAVEQQNIHQRRKDSAIQQGTREMGAFLQKYQRDHGSLQMNEEWLKNRELINELIVQLKNTDLASYKEAMDIAYRTSQETFRNDVAIALNNNLDWLEDTMNRLNSVLRECPTFSNGERYRFRRTVRPQLEPLLRFIKNVASYGPTEDLLGGPGELPEEFRNLLEDKIAPGSAAGKSPLDDYREFFEFDIEILREDPDTKALSIVGHLSKRLGTGSGGEHRAPLYVIAGAALASAYRIDKNNRDGVRLMLLDEAFNKMDPTNIIATMRYLEDLGLQVFMASPGENLGMLTAFLHRYYNILRDVDNNSVELTGRDVSLETREMFRDDLPEFNPELMEQELLIVKAAASQSQPNESKGV